MSNQSNAYDFELFQPKRQMEEAPQKRSNVIELPKEKLEENRRPKTHLGKIIPAFLAFIVVSGIVGTYINGQVQLSALSDALGTAKQSFQGQQNAYSQLKIKSDSTLSMEVVESYASKKLGMKKTNQSQVTPVELSKGDKAQVVTKVSGKNWLEQVWAAIRSYLS